MFKFKQKPFVAMEHGKRDPTTRKNSSKASLLKDSKIGQAILKDNVFEEARLEGEISQINNMQQREAIRLRWEKEYAIKALSRKKLLRREQSSSAVFLFPPISHGFNGSSERIRSEERVNASLSSEGSSPELSPCNSLENIHSKQRVLERRSILRSHSEVTSLPALLSPQLMRKATTNDPRFTNLLQQLVPRHKPYSAAKKQTDNDNK